MQYTNGSCRHILKRRNNIYPKVKRLTEEWNEYLCSDLSDTEIDFLIALLGKILEKAVQRTENKSGKTQRRRKIKFYLRPYIAHSFNKNAADPYASKLVEKVLTDLFMIYTHFALKSTICGR